MKQLKALNLRGSSEGIMSEWISVDEWLPEEGREVLCMISCDIHKPPTSYLLCELKQPGSSFYETWNNEPTSDFEWYVTHWQPLPEPPK